MSKTIKIYGPPGTGKTSAMVKIVSEAITSGTSPASILYLGFTKKSVEVARNRINNPSVVIATIHSFSNNHNHTTKIIDNDDYRFFANKIVGMGLCFSEDQVWQPVDPDPSMEIPNMAISAIDYWRNTLYSSALPPATKDLSSDIIKKIHDEWLIYLKSLNKKDYARTLEEFANGSAKPAFDIVIIDEAQDLTPLQWKCISNIESTHLKYIVGDDDQAIYMFAGARAEDFINYPVDEFHVLDQSYRIPASVHNYALEIKKKIGNSAEKPYKPRNEQGVFSKDIPLSLVDFTNGEDWLVIAHRKAVLRNVSDELHKLGILHKKWDEPSVRPELVSEWKSMTDDEKSAAITKPAFTKTEQGRRDWARYLSFQILKTIDDKGFEIDNVHSINLRNTHTIKGDECANVVFVDDTRYGFDQNFTEERLAYVAVTRAKNRLITRVLPALQTRELFTSWFAAGQGITARMLCEKVGLIATGILPNFSYNLGILRAFYDTFKEGLLSETDIETSIVDLEVAAAEMGVVQPSLSLHKVLEGIFKLASAEQSEVARKTATEVRLLNKRIASIENDRQAMNKGIAAGALDILNQTTYEKSKASSQIESLNQKLIELQTKYSR